MTIREEITALDKLIQFRLTRISQHQVELKKLREQRGSFWRDSGTLPHVLMSTAEQARIDKMPDAGFDCEYCGEDRVKKGKKNVCVACGHEQGVKL